MKDAATLDRTPLVTSTGTRRSPAEEREDLIIRLRFMAQTQHPHTIRWFEVMGLLWDAADELERIDRIIALRGKYRDALNPTRRWWEFWR